MSYGANFETIVPPIGRNRRGRYFNDDTQGAIPIGAPIVYALTGTLGAQDSLGLDPVVMAQGADVGPSELSGIAIYEYAPNAYAGDDPVLTTYSDKINVPAGAAVQMVRGENVKVRFNNTVDNTFLNARDYTGRIMVDLTGIAVGDFLQPEASPDDTNGYWQEAVTPANAWLVVTAVDATRNELEAQMVF